MGCLHTALPQCRCHPPWCRVGVAKEKKPINPSTTTPHRCKISGITQQPPAKPRVWPSARRASQHPHTPTGTPTRATPHHAGPKNPALQPGGALEGWVRPHAGMPGGTPEGDGGLGLG